MNSQKQYYSQKKDLTEEDDKSTGKSKSVPKMICEMFDNASDGITDRLGLDYHTRTKNKHANEVFDIIDIKLK